MESSKTTEVNSVNSEESENKINNLCNMSWLKHNSKSSPEIENLKEINLNEETDIEKKSKTVKKRKQKKLTSDVNSSKDVHSKTSDTDTEHNSKKPEKRKPTVLPVTSITVSNSATVWNSKTDAASTLFPNAQAQPADELEEGLQLSKVLEESILTAQLEQFRMTPEKEKIKNWADDSEEPGWGAIGKNLPEPSENTNRECEIKVEKKPHDDNNNRNKSNIEQDVIKFDKYGRYDGRNERHLFMGRGARMREENYINQHINRNVRTSTNFHGEQKNFRDRNFDTFNNRNKGYKDYDEKNWNHRNRNQKDIDDRNSSSNFDDKREYRNKNFQTSNQRDNFQRETQFHHYQNQSRQQEPCYQRSNKLARYKYRQMDDEQSHERNTKSLSNSEKYDNQQSRIDSQYSAYQNRQFPNKDQCVDSSLVKEFKNAEISDEENKKSTPELPSNESSSIEKIDSTKEEMEPSKLIETNSCTSTSLLDDDSSSLVFMQDNLKDDDSDIQLEANDHASETTSEKSEDIPVVFRNPYSNNVLPYHMIQPTGICANEDGMLPSSQIHNEMGYKLVTNPFMSTPHSQEMLHTETGAVPMQNMDMRFFPQHSMNIVHNHPGNPYLPMINYPMGMQIHSCGQISQVPVGNVQAINYMHQHPLNCQQCPPHYCHSQRIPMQNMNCQNPLYQAQFVTPITTVPLPMAPIGPDQIQSIHHHQGKITPNVTTTPATEIGESANNLATLCESFPSRRMGLPNCPPGFENTVYAKSMQGKIIYNNERELPTFRNKFHQHSRKNPVKNEEYSVEYLNDIIQMNLEIYRSNKNNNIKEEEEADKQLHQKTTIKFTEGSFNDQLFKTYGDSDNKTTRKQNNQAPRPGFCIGRGRGKKLGPTT